ncbi:MAG TPA: DUF2232 domain-containing protein [Beijerinckiaceae bacterium]|jgi:hypothetical protein
MKLSSVGIGIGAGLVSALLIAVVAKATPLALLLFLLAPIPVLIVTLGWDHRAGLVAAAVGGIATALALAPLEGIGFAVGTGLPAWWLGYLALLGRPRADGAIEWYPLGRLLAWIAATAALTVLATAIVSSGDFATFQSRMRRIADLFLQAQLSRPGGAPAPADDALMEAVAQRFAALAPMFAAQGFTLVLTVYVWIGAKVVAVSGRLPRPWPAIPATTMPRSALLMLAGSFGLAYAAGGFAGVFGLALLGATFMAFGLQGLAALHQITAGRTGRTAMLVIAYLLLVMSQGMLFVALILFGIADTLFGLRTRLKLPPASSAGPTPRT